MKSRFFYYNNLVVLSVFIYAVNGQLLGLPENSQCGNNGGICRRLSQCPTVGNPRETRPLLCSFIGREPVVCCPRSRALEMCLMYDRMACNGIEIARRKRKVDESIEASLTISRFPTDMKNSFKEDNWNKTTEIPTTTKMISTSTDRTTMITRLTTPSPNSQTSSAKQKQIITSKVGSTTSLPSTVAEQSTITPSITLTDYNLNSTLQEEEGAAPRILIGEFSEVESNGPHTKVVGGITALPGELPYMALIGFGTGSNREWSCGASIISENFVLSAAHCSKNSVLGPARWVRVGELDLSRENTPHQDIGITAIHVHPGYNEPAVYNDIALFRLAVRLTFNSWIQPLCLQTASSIQSARGIAAGWGRTDFVGDTSEKLLKVDLSLVDTSRCRTLLGRAGRFLPQGVNLDTMICAGEKEGGKDTCTGDSGGPLVIKGVGQCIRTQIGVVSFGRQCAMPDTPGIYTKVSSFISWIEPIVWPR